MSRAVAIEKKRNIVLWEIKQYILSHDDDVVFAIAYLASSVVLSLLFSLGAFAVLAGFHLTIDIIKHKLIGANIFKSIARGLRDSLIDISFLFLGFAISVYFEYAFALGLSRGLVELRYLRIFQIFPKLGIMNKVADDIAYFFLRIREHNYQIAFDGNFTVLEKIFIAVVLVSLCFVALSPLLIGLNIESIWHIFLHEFRLAIVI